MSNQNYSQVKVQQCLFGYDDGHRLLSSSLKLTNDVESLLLRLSDLAPGNIELTESGYWTGVPLPSIKHYALLHTWPAPEMSRPGCVWTHVLLIGFADIARFVDLSILTKFSVRPTKKSYREKYSQTLFLSENTIKITENFFVPKISSDNLLKVIRAVYKSDREHYLFADSNELDATVFRVWSQQWPRLRRSFSFRTTGSISEKLNTGVCFDLRVLPQSDQYYTADKQPRTLESEPWETEALKDALSLTPTDFRKFIWRYGSDVHKGCAHFSFLAEIYIFTHNSSFEIKNFDEMLYQIANRFPDSEDGKAIKSDLIEGDNNTYSLIPGVDLLDSLTFFINHPNVKGLPLPSESAFTRLRQLWSTRSKEIIKLAEQAIKKQSTLQQNILKQLTELIDSKVFFSVTSKSPYLRNNLILEKPSLLDSDELLNIAKPELLELLSFISNNQELPARVIRRLIYLNDQSVAENIFTQFPNVVTRIVVESIDDLSLSSNENTPKVWLQAITKSVPDFIQGGYIEKLKSIDTLAVFADALGYQNFDVLNAGPLPWAAALLNITDDIRVNGHNKLYAFLLMMAIEKPLHGCEVIFERTFERIHTALASDKLDSDSKSMIVGSLPDINWWQKWDICYRLRLAVVKSYVNNNLDPESFKRLTSDQKLASDLVGLAIQNKKGQNFFKKKRNSLKKKQSSHKKKRHAGRLNNKK